MEGRVGRAGSHAFSTYSVHTPLTSAARDPINQWQVGPWRRGARRHRVLMKMLRVCDAAKGSARRHLPRFERFFRLLEPTGRVERGCACERVHMHMCEARLLERLFRACGLRSAFRKCS